MMHISICIPHHNRSRYLLRVLDSVVSQDYPSIEAVISDDCSDDDSALLIPQFISAHSSTARVRFRYLRQSRNLGYDANLRAAMAAARGDYLFLLGNDDALAAPDTISKLTKILGNLEFPEIAYTNVCLYSDPGQVAVRARRTHVIGEGAEAAVREFRSFSFFGGLVIKRSAFLENDSDCVDGSVYVQIYLGARIITCGGRLAAIAEAMVAKDVTVAGAKANSYADVLASRNARLHKEAGGLDQVGRVACRAILPMIPSGRRWWFACRIYAQLLAYSYPYWLYTYRAQGVYRAAVNLALGCFPPSLVIAQGVSSTVPLALIPVYMCATLVGLCFPIPLLGVLKPWVVKLSKLH